MAKVSRVLRVFRLLVDNYDAQVHYGPGETGEKTTNLIITLTAYGQTMSFNRGKEFQLFCVGRTREEFGEVLTPANMNMLYQQLEGIAKEHRPYRPHQSCCGCDDGSLEMEDE